MHGEWIFFFPWEYCASHPTVEHAYACRHRHGNSSQWGSGDTEPRRCRVLPCFMLVRLPVACLQSRAVRVRAACCDPGPAADNILRSTECSRDGCMFVCVCWVGWLLVLDSSRKTNMFFRSVTQRTPAPAAVVDCRAPCFEFFIIEYHK